MGHPGVGQVANSGSLAALGMKNQRTPLLAVDLIVLGGDDLPLAVALQPGVGPDLALLQVGMGLVSADVVFAAVDDGQVFAEEAHLGIVEREPCAEYGPFSSRSSSALCSALRKCLYLCRP